MPTACLIADLYFRKLKTYEELLAGPRTRKFSDKAPVVGVIASLKAVAGYCDFNGFNGHRFPTNYVSD